MAAFPAMDEFPGSHLKSKAPSAQGGWEARGGSTLCSMLGLAMQFHRGGSSSGSHLCPRLQGATDASPAKGS